MARSSKIRIFLFLFVVLIFNYFQIFENKLKCSIKADQRGVGQLVIAFSYFRKSSEESIYDIGLVNNALAIPEIYGSKWIMRVYHDVENVANNPYLQKLTKMSHVDLCYVRDILDAANIMVPTTWRFLPLIDPLVNEFHSRDLDSLPTFRELAAVEEFRQNPNAQFHIMRDHKQHMAPLTAGMWGAKPIKDLDFAYFVMAKIVKAAQDRQLFESRGKDTDQAILARYLYPYLNGKVLAHDSYNCQGLRINLTRPFPTKRLETESYNFVGAVRYGIHEIPMLETCPPPCRPPNHQDWIYC